MDSFSLAPSQRLRPKGFLGLSIAGVKGAFLSLPGLLVLAAAWWLVAAVAGLVAALPVLVAASLSQDMATVVGALMALICLPFLLIWLAAGWGAALAWIGSRTLGAPLGLGEALGLGVRRALPVLGTAIGMKLLGALAFLPAAFLATVIALLSGQDALPTGPMSLLRPAGLTLAALAALGGLYISLRLLLSLWPALLEDRGPFAAIGRGWELSRGQAGRMLLYLLLFVGLAFALLDGLLRLWKGDEAAALAAIAAQLPTLADLGRIQGSAWRYEGVGPAELGWLFVVAALVIGAQALVHACLAAFYFDLRRRQEGFGATVGREPEGTAPGEGGPEPETEAEEDEPETSAQPLSPDVDDPWTAPWGDAPAPDDTTAPAEAYREAQAPPSAATDEPARDDLEAESVQPEASPEALEASLDSPDPSPADNAPVDPQLDLSSLQGISLAGSREDLPAAPARRNRLAWLWSWLPEPESTQDDV